MSKISTCLIVKNESSCIRKCLDSILPFSDEVIIYDTGSEDGTQDICLEYENVKVIQGTWNNDFSEARNESFKYATKEYIMWVDADDIIDTNSQNWLINFKKSELSKYDIVFLEYIYDMTEEGTYTTHFYRERIFRRSLKPKWISPIHEYVLCEGDRIYHAKFDDMKITHRKHSPNPLRNISIYKKLESEGKITTGRDWFYYAQECRWHENIDSAIEKYNKALSCPDLWYVDALNTLYQMAIIYKNDKKDSKLALKYAYDAVQCTRVPRADVCCLIGDIYLEDQNYRVASMWFKLAVNNIPDEFEGTFMLECYNKEYAMLQACVSLYNEGLIEESEKYNDMVLELYPEHEMALQNKDFFNNLKK